MPRQWQRRVCTERSFSWHGGDFCFFLESDCGVCSHCLFTDHGLPPFFGVLVVPFYEEVFGVFVFGTVSSKFLGEILVSH